MRKIAKNQKGLSLIELMIAIFILLVGILGVLTMFPIGSGQGKSAEMETIAIQLGQAKIEEIVAKSYTEILAENITEGYTTISGFPSYKRVTSINYVYVDNNKVLYPDQSAASDTGIKKIEITVFWNPPLTRGERNIKIVNLVTKK